MGVLKAGAQRDERVLNKGRFCIHHSMNVWKWNPFRHSLRKVTAAGGLPVFRHGRRLLFWTAFALLAGIFAAALHHHLIGNEQYYQLEAYTTEGDVFRCLAFGEEGISQAFDFAGKEGADAYEALAVWMITNDYDLEGAEKLSPSFFQEKRKGLLRYKELPFRKLCNAYRLILSDLKYFPIPENEAGEGAVSYVNSWGVPRTYGGDRTHEGTDIMAVEKERDYYPVVSVSDGMVEKKGWLELGGYRLGVRTESGLYVYYAHLSGYAEDIEEGTKVKAGQLLGFMGDTGYSKVEGTTGNFAVHLHFGLYMKTDHYEEISMNPYYVLKYLEKNKLKYSYEK